MCRNKATKNQNHMLVPIPAGTHKYQSTNMKYSQVCTRFLTVLNPLCELPAHPVHSHNLGLHLIPGLLPPSTQRTLLSRLWLRDLTDPRHQTNLNLHYNLPYPSFTSGTCSFFHYPNPAEVLLEPKEPNTHKPLTVVQMLNKKLRWMTLGGQYDWTKKVYPEMDYGADLNQKELPVPFPADIARMINSIVCTFPSEARRRTAER